MNNNEEKVLRGKMDRLDTLAGGIVYGKEEAWDKLQARMDRKPARKVMLRYWVAAAAVLLLMVTIMVGYNRQKTEVATIIKTEKDKPVAVKSIAAAPHAVEVPQQPKAMVENQELQVKITSKRYYKKPLKDVVTKLTVVVEPETPGNPNITATELLTLRPNLPPIARTIKVVHINDLEHGGAEQNNTTVATNAPVYVMSKLPVVHINEVEREAQDVKQILRENRMTYRHIPFLKSAYDEYMLVADDNSEPINFFKIKFATQN